MCSRRESWPLNCVPTLRGATALPRRLRADEVVAFCGGEGVRTGVAWFISERYVDMWKY